MSELNSVQKFYAGKVIFITGGSGFMGKVLVEKLLYSCSDVKELILLMRPKRGKSASQRVEDFAKLPMFKRILEEKPEVMKKIFPVWGEITEPNFGLSNEDYKRVTETSQIMFHLAASLKLEATLKPNILMNLTGTKYVLDMAKQMKNLIQMIHTSTAFCNIEHEVMEEKVYDFPHKPEDLIRCAEWMSEESMAAAQKEILGVHPNTYTYTKRLAEILVRDEYNKGSLPVCIVRPSIVAPAHKDPLPGWVDSLNGPPGVILAGGKGVLRCMMFNENAKFEAIPVDGAIQGMIMIAKHLATSSKRSVEIPVFNVTQHESQRITYREFFNFVNDHKFDIPFSQSVWFPNVEITHNKFYYMMNVFLFQWIPAYFIDFLFLLIGQDRFMVHVQKKLAIGMDVLNFFAMNDWNFKSDNFQNLVKIQSPEEYKMFMIDTENGGEVYSYLRKCLIGGREYCGRDPMSTISRARILVRIQFIVDRLLKAFILFWFISKVSVFTGFLLPIIAVLGYYAVVMIRSLSSAKLIKSFGSLKQLEKTL